jgi:serine/threonine protein kinase/putative intracellular protease/amidase
MSVPADLEEIFFAALARDTMQERAAFLEETCRNEPDTRGEVERLLAAHARLDDFLEQPPAAVAAAAEKLRAPAPGEAELSFLQPPTRPESLGRLGHYEILEVVGSGGFGVVLRAFDDKLHRAVAIKTLSQSLVGSATARQRFVREARAAAAVNHDNVVHIYEVEEAGPIPYLVMEYVAGLSLHEKLKQQGPLELAEILRIGLQVAEGLAAAHAQGLVHRDIKPANILLEGGTGRVKLTDFGLARAVDDSSLSREGMVAGTPEYMSPEQARGEAIDHRSDLFSLGSVLYAMCTGHSPFAAEGSLAVLKRICKETPQPVQDLRSDIPAALAALIARLHAKRPADRPSSAGEVRVLLDRCRNGSLSRSAASMIGRRPWLVAAGSALGVGGLLLCLYRLRNPRAIPETAPASETAELPTPPPLAPRRRWRPRVLLIIAPRDFYYPEYGPVRNALENNGVECRVASTTLAKCLPNDKSPQIPVTPELLLADAQIADYDAVYFCGGEGCLEYAEGGRFSTDARRLIREAVSAKCMLAAMGLGVVVLAEADVLRGRQAACHPYGTPPGIYVRRIGARGVHCTQDAVVEDGLFLTGRAPQDVRLFNYSLLKRLGIDAQPQPGAAPSD